MREHGPTMVLAAALLAFFGIRAAAPDRPAPPGEARADKADKRARTGPTSANMCPLRVVFVKSPEAKERLRPALHPGNVEKTMAAPVFSRKAVPA